MPRPSSIPGVLAAGLVLAACGCRGPKSAAEPGAGTNAAPVVVRPLDASVGRVVQVNGRLRFAVLDYTLNRMPPPGSELVLYRSTNVVGSLRISGWRNSLTVAADFLEGVPEPGDVARPR